ncbi:Fc receptor-like protein 5 isoform X3 [Colossoma macropomum]|uniref:Fc receptor-like protein 5 isoform X3 n=1 Tax=Colossoma macropomum TaxID=42526 RepID=UPI001864296C|nr:Fc receptor-like protein 5 isoform X3 [Colossoma macropomum]
MAFVKFILIAAVFSMVLSLSKEEDPDVITKPMAMEAKVHISKPSITASLNHQVLYQGEDVVLQCKVPEKLTDLEYAWDKDSVPIKSSQSTYNISGATVSDSGKYSCMAKRGTTTSEKSDPQVLTVKNPPQPKVILSVGWNHMFTGEKVTLICEIPDTSTGWKYTWLRNSLKIPDDVDTKKTGNSLSILSTKQKHHGNYTCETELQDRPLSRLLSSKFALSVQDPPQPKVILSVGWSRVFTGEKVTLICKVPNTPTSWKYTWLRNSLKISDDVDTSNTGNSLSILSAKQRHHGNYTCETELQDRPLSKALSTKFALSVQDPPQPKVILSVGWSRVFTGEKVTLICKVPDTPTSWKYTWLRNSLKISDDVDTSNTGNSLSILSAKQRHHGNYTCETELQDRPLSKALSTKFALSVQDPPQPKVILSVGWSRVFTGEKVTLICKVPDTPTSWKYTWLRNSLKISDDVDTSNTGNSLSILSAKQRHHGNYTCETELQDRPLSKALSTKFALSVQDPPQPKVILSVGWSRVFTGEKVTLICKVPDTPTSWKYTWLRNSLKISDDVDTSNTGNSLSILSAKQRHHGNYTCETELQDRPLSKALSTKFALSVQDPPQPKVILSVGWSRVFTGEKVTLICKVPDTPTSWKYTWLRNSLKISDDVDTSNTGNSLSILSAKQRHHGNYTCETELQDRPLSKALSTKFALSVQDPPQPKVILSVGWSRVFTGEKVTLICKVPDTPTSWKYTWLRNSLKISDDVDTSNTGNSLSILSAKQRHHGNYTCETELQDRPLSKALSTKFALSVQDPPQPKVILSVGWSRVFTGEKVTLICKVPDTPTSWKYTWLRNSLKISDDVDTSNTGNSLSILSAKQRHHGNYTCETELQDRPLSKALSTKFALSVQARPPASLTLETSWSDIMSVDTLTLKCEIKDGTLEWNYTWYKDGLFEQTILEETYSVKATEETFKSEYKCRGNRTVRPLYSSFSEGFKANNIVLKRKVLLAISGCVVCSIILLIIGCIVLRFTRKPEKQEMVKEDLFFSMTDSKTQTTSPLQEYLTEIGPPLDKEERDESTAILNEATPIIEDQIKEGLPSKEAGGFTSFKVEKSPLKEKDGLQSLKERDESTALLNEAVPAVDDQINVEVSPPKETGGFTSFKADISPSPESNGLSSYNVET